MLHTDLRTTTRKYYWKRIKYDSTANQIAAGKLVNANNHKDPSAERAKLKFNKNIPKMTSCHCKIVECWLIMSRHDS